MKKLYGTVTVSIAGFGREQQRSITVNLARLLQPGGLAFLQEQVMATGAGVASEFLSYHGEDMERQLQEPPR